MGRPKHELPVAGGATMIQAVIGALAVVCRQVVVAGDVDAGLRSVLDRRPGAGPLGGIEALLESDLDEQYLVCPCDLPLVTAPLLARLTEHAGAPATVFAVEGEDHSRPLPARLSAAALPEVRRLLDGGQRAVGRLMAEIGPRIVVLSAAEAAALADVDTPQAYEALGELF